LLQSLCVSGIGNRGFYCDFCPTEKLCLTLTTTSQTPAHWSQAIMVFGFWTISYVGPRKIAIWSMIRQ